ncbi:MAG: hypothetical protein KDC05_09660 [Bacteroidales bacterium]|nr:hypothetical protein [Bacteroidales bacterium]
MDNLFVKTLLDVIHVLATVLWIGGMFINFIIIRPLTMKVLDPVTAGQFNMALMKKFRIIVYASIVLLGVTGIPLKIVNPNYIDIINFENQWEIVSFIKHLFYGLLVILAVFNFEIVSPNMARAAAGKHQPQLLKWRQRAMISGMLAMFSAIVILILSSMMRYL